MSSYHIYSQKKPRYYHFINILLVENLKLFYENVRFFQQYAILDHIFIVITINLEFFPKMYLRSMKNYQSMNIVYTTPEGNHIWLGDYYAATDLALLKSKKITSVLTAAAMLGVKYPKDAEINHKVLNAFDIPTYKMTPHFDEAFQFIKKGLQNGNVLVHCAAGISRSTTCVLVYLMRQKGYGFKQSLQLVRNKRPIVNPNYGFQNQLAKFEQTLKKGGLKMNQKDEQKVFSQKADRTVEQIQEEKDAFFKFINKQSNLNKTQGVNKTKYKGYYGGKKVSEEPNMTSYKQEEQPKGIRGQSLNYKSSNTSYPNKINNLTFKLEHPKIVTIKK